MGRRSSTAADRPGASCSLVQSNISSLLCSAGLSCLSPYRLSHTARSYDLYLTCTATPGLLLPRVMHSTGRAWILYVVTHSNFLPRPRSSPGKGRSAGPPLLMQLAPFVYGHTSREYIEDRSPAPNRPRLSSPFLIRSVPYRTPAFMQLVPGRIRRCSPFQFPLLRCRAGMDRRARTKKMKWKISIRLSATFLVLSFSLSLSPFLLGTLAVYKLYETITSVLCTNPFLHF
ncbi:hypothetical protein GGR52DRAFT_279205 [Hypoxylon sp. FL1284]|nr:hypothetical protein GGR52DRAFT_279205 [Hypoxylon sp. FL1284]